MGKKNLSLSSSTPLSEGKKEGGRGPFPLIYTPNLVKWERGKRGGGGEGPFSLHRKKRKREKKVANSRGRKCRASFIFWKKKKKKTTQT